MNTTKINAEKDIDSFIMMGQSNMAGRGRLGEVKPIDNDNLLMYRQSYWIKLQEPVTIDGAFGNEYSPGISIAGSFCEEYYKTYNKKVGVIPCAKGGSRICEWQPGEPLFENAVLQAKFAMRQSNLKALLWHQGEGDCTKEKTDEYYNNLNNMVTAFRKSLNMPNLPIIVGEISENIDAIWKITKESAVYFNKKLAEAVKKIDNCYLVKASELELKFDGLHFNSNSLRTLGVRYFNVYKNI